MHEANTIHTVVCLKIVISAYEEIKFIALAYVTLLHFCLAWL